MLPGLGFVLQHGDVIGDATEQAQDADLVNHGLLAPGGGSRGELAVGSGEARQFVEVDFPGCRFPPDPGDWVVLEQQAPADRHPPRKFKRRVIEYQEVNPWGQQDVK